MQGNGRRVPLGMDSRWRDERAGCTMITGTFGTTTREHQRKKETYQTWFTSTTRRSEYKYGIAMRTLRRACSCEVAGGWVMKNGLRLWCCGKELWGLGWATDVVCTMYPGSDDGSGTGKKGRKREERHRRDTSASPPRVLAESVKWRKAHCLSAASYQIRCLSSYSSCPVHLHTLHTNTKSDNHCLRTTSTAYHRLLIIFSNTRIHSLCIHPQ